MYTYIYIYIIYIYTFNLRGSRRRNVCTVVSDTAAGAERPNASRRRLASRQLYRRTFWLYSRISCYI